MRHEVRRTGWFVAAGLASAVVLSPALSSGQDLTLKGTINANGRETPTVQYITPTAMRTASGPDGEVIVRLDQKKFYQVNTKQKTYSEMTFDELQKTMDAATAAMDKLPPEAKKMMGGMGMGMGGDLTVTPTGPGETIAGYATEKYHVTMGTMMEMDIWAAPSLTVPPAYYDAMKAIPSSNPMMDMKKLYEEYKKIKGYPVKTVTNMKAMGRSITTTNVTTAVDKGPIPAATFEVPAGFKRVQMK